MLQGIRTILAVCLLAAGITAVTVAPTGAASGGLTVHPPSTSGGRIVYAVQHDSAGYFAAVKVTCSGTATCKGKMAIDGYGSPYSIPVGGTTYVRAPIQDATALNHVAGNGVVGQPGYVPVEVNLNIAETSPVGRKVVKLVLLEEKATADPVVLRVAGPDLGTGVSEIRASLWSYRGNASRRLVTFDVPNTGVLQLPAKYFPLGRNNEASPIYLVSVSAKVTGDSARREWFFRGTSTDGYGGGRDAVEGTGINATKLRGWTIKANYQRVEGTITNGGAAANGAVVRVLVPPANMPATRADRRSLDSEFCANEFGRQKLGSSGFYRINFIPYDERGRPSPRTHADAPMVEVDPSTSSQKGVLGQSGVGWADCLSALKHNSTISDNDTLTYAGNQATPVLATGTQELSTGQVTGKIVIQPQFSGADIGDRETKIRGVIPELAVLDGAVVRRRLNSTYTDANIPLRPGKYWIEVGRTTGCSQWYPSVYPDNSAYFKDDRYTERWKSFAGTNPYSDGLTSAMFNMVYETGFAGGNSGGSQALPSGYKGWMYRDICRTIGAGYYKQTTIAPNGGDPTWAIPVSKGATISGHVTRVDGRSNKEMLVSAYSTDGKVVMRSAYTNSSGNFTIRGLQGGKYYILVNGDSWRGIGRQFSGAHEKTVSTGGSYSVGTLYFRG